MRKSSFSQGNMVLCSKKILACGERLQSRVLWVTDITYPWFELVLFGKLDRSPRLLSQEWMDRGSCGMELYVRSCEHYAHKHHELITTADHCIIHVVLIVWGKISSNPSRVVNAFLDSILFRRVRKRYACSIHSTKSIHPIRMIFCTFFQNPWFRVTDIIYWIWWVVTFIWGALKKNPSYSTFWNKIVGSAAWDALPELP